MIGMLSGWVTIPRNCRSPLIGSIGDLQATRLDAVNEMPEGRLPTRGSTAQMILDGESCRSSPPRKRGTDQIVQTDLGRAGDLDIGDLYRDRRAHRRGQRTSRLSRL